MWYALSMSNINPEKLQKYLTVLLNEEVELLNIYPLGGMDDVEFVLKDFGYGTPLKIVFKTQTAEKSVVLSTVRPGGFGHNHMSDRASILLWQGEAFNQLPQHVRSIDVGAFTKKGGFQSLSGVEEMFLLMEHVEGTEYFRDLDRIKTSGTASELDLRKVETLAQYLAKIHETKHENRDYYERRTRELIGHNECMFGLTDSYPMDHEWIKPEFLAEIEKACIDWRWKLKTLTHRLSQIHGDFHPFNILFREGVDFTALDRSRGTYGEPADDLAGLSINYLFWGLLHKGDFEMPFKWLWERFYETYLSVSNDEEVLMVIPPYLSWRALVVASPVWYPHINIEVRKKLLNFARNILDIVELDWKNILDLLEDRN
jgi:hypothetical protein